MQHGLIEPLAAKGIRINTVSPGVTETDMVSICVEPASPRHRAGIASMAWRSTR